MDTVYYLDILSDFYCIFLGIEVKKKMLEFLYRFSISILCLKVPNIVLFIEGLAGHFTVLFLSILYLYYKFINFNFYYIKLE